MRKCLAYRAALLASAIPFGQSAGAQSVIYSNMSAGDAFVYSANATWVISSFRTTGARFVSDAATDLMLGSVQAPMFTGCLYVGTVCQPPTAGTSMQISLNVFADSNNAPGALLAQSAPVSVTTTGMPYSFAFPTGTILESGETYWINATTTSPASLGAGWAWNLQGASGVAVWQGGTYSTYFTGAEVGLSVLAVPEPGQWALLLLGVPVLLHLRRRTEARG